MLWTPPDFRTTKNVVIARAQQRASEVTGDRQTNDGSEQPAPITGIRRGTSRRPSFIRGDILERGEVAERKGD